MDGMSDLITAILNTGLRSISTLITSGSEATQKVAVVSGIYLMYSYNKKWLKDDSN